MEMVSSGSGSRLSKLILNFHLPPCSHSMMSSKWLILSGFIGLNLILQTRQSSREKSSFLRGLIWKSLLIMFLYSSGTLLRKALNFNFWRCSVLLGNPGSQIWISCSRFYLALVTKLQTMLLKELSVTPLIGYLHWILSFRLTTKTTS